MERKIGEIFEYNGEWYQCVEGNDCANCNFIDYCKSHSKEERDSAIGLCVSFDRSDGTHVVFKKLEKVGEPYPNADKLYQLYKLPMNIEKLPPHTEGINLVRFDIVEIEIKQNKEDMEETSLPKEDNPLTRVVYAYVNGKISDKELIRSIKEMSDEYPYNKNNLKPFSLELARQGKPVCTRDGRKAIFLTTLSNKNFPVVAIVSCGQEENVYQYDINGVCDEHDDNLDLMMLPEKKEGWVNMYRDEESKRVYCGEFIFSEREKAKKHYECNDGTRFDSEEQALEYDVLLSECNYINDVIGRKVELEYDQYVQRNAETVKKQWRMFCNIVAAAIPDYAKMANECGNGTRHRSHIGRVIGDYNIKCLCNLYFRFGCIDEQGREYQQPYFANGHQDEATREVMSCRR